MTVISTTPDRENLELTVVAEFDASVEQVWQVWENPRKLEKWLGPPTWPATFTGFDFSDGGMAEYHMTGPEGGREAGYWRFLAIEANRKIRFKDGFAKEDGSLNEDMPTMVMTMTLDEADGKTTMTTVSKFNSADELEQLLEMGMAEGITLAMGQIDDVL